MSQQASSSTGFNLKSIPQMFRFGRQKKGFERRHQRFDCTMVGQMNLVEIGATFDGMILEISCGGCVFRPASMFILDRNNEVVIIQTEYFSVEGRIRASRVSGYGIQFFHEIDQSVVDDIVNLNGVKIEDSIFARKL